MRVKQPEPFDREREYKPGERAIVNGAVLIATLWTPAAQRLADSPETLFCQRCVRCKIGKDICTGANLKCDKYSRTDRKTIFWRLAYPKSNAVRTIKKKAMNKQVLSPFDCDMCAKIEALKQAIRGRLGDRFIEFFYDEDRQSVYMKYDPTEYPEEICTRLVEPDATAGTRYCRTLLEVDAIQVRRDNLDDLLRFTGGGTMTIPRTPNGRAVYSFTDGNGIFIDAPETYYIVREPDGRLTTRPEREFNREFEPKGVSVPKEPGDKGCGTCRYFNPEFPVNGKPVPICLALKMIKGGTEYTNPRGTQPHFRCSCGKYERRY